MVGSDWLGTLHHLEDQILNSVIQLRSGAYFSLQQPEHGPFDIEEIAHALANLCRFNGHSRQFYSVAQHSVLVSQHVPAALAMEALLHDAAEAFIGDVPTPIKMLLPDLQSLEARIDQAVRRHYRLPNQLSAAVHHADRVLLATERRDLLAEQDRVWPVIADVDPLPEVISPVLPNEARSLFLDRFEALQDSGP